MDTENKNEIDIKLNPEDLKEIKENPLIYYQSQLIKCDEQIAVLKKDETRIKMALERLDLSDAQIVNLEKEKEDNKASLNRFYAVREELENHIKEEGNM